MRDERAVAEGFVDSNGLRLHSLEWAAGVGLPPLALLHANGFLARLWQQVAERLAGRYHVFALDMRGHGDSDKPDPANPANYNWRNLVADFRGFLDALGLRSLPVVGHSSGGAVSAYLAATQPEYVSRLVLIEPIIIPTPLAGSDLRNDLADGARRRREVWDSPQEMIDSYRRRPLFGRWTEEALRLYGEYGTFRREDGRYQLKCSGETEARMFENTTSLDVWEVLPRIPCPALLLKGEHTDPFLSRLIEAATERIPGARQLTVPHAAHLVPMERPHELTQEILAFFGESR